MELVKVGERTYYIKNPTNIGIYLVDQEHVYLIDTGNDKEAGKKILKIVEEQGWKVKGIINTHSNADHIGGNKVIQDRTGCEVYCYGMESAFTSYPILESSFLYGGYPLKELQNKFLLAKESKVTLIQESPVEGLEIILLKGHFFDMVGIRTSDDVIFLADSVFSKETIEKYHLFFLYDVKEYLNTLEIIRNTQAKLLIPSHCEACTEIKELLDSNQNKISEVSERIENFCNQPRTFEEILKYIFDSYNLMMNSNQYVLIGSTVKSYLSYLTNENRIHYEFSENKMLWKKV